METQCPQCKARFAPGATCQDLFYTCLSLEFEQPAYGAVHHLTVLCYYLQHNLYSRHAWLAARELLGRFVYEHVPPERARGQIQRALGGFKRDRLTRGEKLPGVGQVEWSCTIADLPLDSAELYAAHVRRWARTVLEDSEHLADLNYVSAD